jgi:flagellar hook-basal body complex protein FliE
MEINKISSMVPQMPEISMGEEKPESAAGASSFSSMLSKSLSETNDLIQVSDQKGKELAIGKTENLHEAMIGFEKAETALKLLVQVRNKALEAYNQVLAMQV